MRTVAKSRTTCFLSSKKKSYYHFSKVLLGTELPKIQYQLHAEEWQQKQGIWLTLVDGRFQNF